MIARRGKKVANPTLAELVLSLEDKPALEDKPEALPPFSALFASGQWHRTAVGIAIYAAATTAYFCSAILLPKALVEQGASVGLSFGLGSLLFLVTIPGKFFTGYIMEVIGRRWTIAYCLGGAVPGLYSMGAAHSFGSLATVSMTAGAGTSSGRHRDTSCPPSSRPSCWSRIWARPSVLRQDRGGGGDRRLRAADVRHGDGREARANDGARRFPGKADGNATRLNFFRRR